MCLFRAGPLRKLWSNNLHRQLEVKVLPHMAESRVGVLINNPTVGTESKLSVPPSEVKRLPHEALVSVEI